MISLQPSSTAIVAWPGPAARGTLTDPDEHADHYVAGWTADDDGLVVMSDHDREFHAIWLARPDGAWRTLVEDADHDLGAVVSPDGTAMVVSHHVDGARPLAVHQADGTTASTSTSARRAVAARWAPDWSASW